MLMGMTRGGGEGRNELYNHVLQMFIRSQAYVSKGEYPHHPCYHRQKATLLCSLAGHAQAAIGGTPGETRCVTDARREMEV